MYGDRGGGDPANHSVGLSVLALLWQIFGADERDGIPKSVFQ